MTELARSSASAGQITVRGPATAEELAAVLAVVSRGGSSGHRAPADRLSSWRALRIAAVRASTKRAH